MNRILASIPQRLPKQHRLPALSAPKRENASGFHRSIRRQSDSGVLPATSTSTLPSSVNITMGCSGFGCCSFGLACDALVLQSPPVAAKLDMNGTESKIEIFKPFGEAFELMKQMLFQPFDLKKWLVLGFAAWLANLVAGGGGGGNFRYPDNRREEAHKLNETIGQIPQPVLITVICILVCLVLLLIVLFVWLRARGRFILVDCIVRNRATIVEPWKEFREEGNSFFLFSLVVVLALIVVMVIAGLALIVPFIPWGDQAQPGF